MPRRGEDGESAPKRRGRQSSHGGDSTSSDIPFRDADLELGEIPVDELDTFVVPGSDERGAGEHVHLRMTPYLRRQLRIILTSNRFPYLNESALIRHAIVRHVTWLVSLRNSIPKHILPQLSAVLEVCRDDEMRIYLENVFEKIDQRITFHLSRGDHAEVIRLLNLVKARMSGVQPSTWQRRFWNTFNEKWAGYLASPGNGGGTNAATH